MFAEYLAAREEGKVYHGVFVTASPTLKEQVQAAFTKYQVCALYSIGTALLVSRPLAGLLKPSLLQTDALSE
jgi:hypothetical protein